MPSTIWNFCRGAAPTGQFASADRTGIRRAKLSAVAGVHLDRVEEPPAENSARVMNGAGARTSSCKLHAVDRRLVLSLSTSAARLAAL